MNAKYDNLVYGEVTRWPGVRIPPGPYIGLDENKIESMSLIDI